MSSKAVELCRFPKGAVLIKEGTINSRIFRLKSGEVTYRKNRGNKVLSVITINPPSMFGEMSIFNRPEYGDYVATKDVEAYVMDVPSLYHIFALNPALSRRFNLQIAKLLASRLSNLEVAKPDGNEKSVLTPREDQRASGGSGDNKLPSIPSSDSNESVSGSSQQQSRTVLEEIMEPESPRKRSTSKSRQGNSRVKHHSQESKQINSGNASSDNGATDSEILFGRNSPNKRGDRKISKNERIHVKQVQSLPSSSRPFDSEHVWQKFWGADSWESSITSFFSEDITYKDPFGSAHGFEELIKHKKKLHDIYPEWKWNLIETVGTKELIIQKWKISIGTVTTCAVSWCILSDIMKMTSCEIYFDTWQVRTMFEFRSSLSRRDMVVMMNDITDPRLLRRKSSPHLTTHSSERIEVSNPRKNSSPSPRDHTFDDSIGQKHSMNSTLRASTGSLPTIQKSLALPLGAIQTSTIPESTTNTNNPVVSSKANRTRSTSSGAPSNNVNSPKKDKSKKEANNTTTTTNASPSEKPDMFLQSESNSVVGEFRCEFKLKEMGSLTLTGLVTIGNKYLSINGGFLGMNAKEVIPIKNIDKIRSKESERLITLKWKKSSSTSNQGGGVTNQTLTVPNQPVHTTKHNQLLSITFLNPTQFTEAERILKNLISDNEKPELSPRPKKESSLLDDIFNIGSKFNLPSSNIKFSKQSPAIRLSYNKMSTSDISMNAIKQEMVKLLIDGSIAGLSISTYPFIPKPLPDGTFEITDERLGNPICDQFILERYHNRTLFAIADGCNWGVKPRNAAKAAVKTFIEFNRRYIFDSSTDTTQHIMKSFLRSFAAVQTKILEGFEENWWDCGTTTLLGGAIVETEDPDRPWAFISLNVGDCKAYRIRIKSNPPPPPSPPSSTSSTSSTNQYKRTELPITVEGVNSDITNPEYLIDIVDLTSGSRTGVGALDARDCGGRLGAYKQKNPDLRNLMGFHHFLQEGDFVMLCSDGVYDNLDPQSLGIPPSDIGISEFSDWEVVETDDNLDVKVLEKVEDAKSGFMMKLLSKLVYEALTENKSTLTSSTNATINTESPSSSSSPSSTTSSTSPMSTNTDTQPLHLNVKLTSANSSPTKSPRTTETEETSSSQQPSTNTTTISTTSSSSSTSTLRSSSQNIPSPLLNTSCNEPSCIVTRILEHCKHITQSTRDYMENNPTGAQPTDHKLFPGKVDHTTCVVFKVGKTSFRQTEVDLEDLVLRLRHPHDKKENIQGFANSTATFKGTELVSWLEHDQNDTKKITTTIPQPDIPQSLLNFNYISPVTSSDSFIYETFQPDVLYQFKVKEPMMNNNDWKILLETTITKNFKKGDIIIKEGSIQTTIYQITYGTCRIEKLVKNQKNKKVLSIVYETNKKTVSIKPSVTLYNILEKFCDNHNLVLDEFEAYDVNNDKIEVDTLLTDIYGSQVTLVMKNDKGQSNSNNPDKRTKDKRDKELKTTKKQRVDDLSSFFPKKEKKSNNSAEKPQVMALGTIGAPQTFGELSVLGGGGRASATVIAESEEVQVMILDTNLANAMFVRFPDMAGRFYHYLASVLARRLSFHEAGNQEDV
eukprot:TRINITY_DN3738_c2_g1_i3.p1 TRINITY_DN3738_c2_g1~~TRINITY_DN3738_c2_g1_i3.p1  ORF type:complete len:1577 (+),score=500.93 TRINITY_DN3738_c2_g1_i3:781-5511(+)